MLGRLSWCCSTRFLRPPLPCCKAQIRCRHGCWVTAVNQRSVQCSTATNGQQPTKFQRGSEDHGSTWSLDTAGARQEWHRPDIHLVLVNPQIPQNTGNIARSCAATAVALHIVGPMGFDLDDKKLKRAGLDYWPFVFVKYHESWQNLARERWGDRYGQAARRTVFLDFYAYFSHIQDDKRLVAFTVFGSSYYAAPEFEYRPGDWLVFGAETSGLPDAAKRDVGDSGGALVKIPIMVDHVRSLNLAVAAGIGLFEALRQLDAGKHEVKPREQTKRVSPALPKDSA